MTDLGALLASADLALLGKDVWLLIGARMDMRSACRFAQTCRAGRALLQVDKHNEVRFRREKSPVSIVEGVGQTWFERFRLAKPCDSFVAAGNAVRAKGVVATIVLCPGEHVIPERRTGEEGWVGVLVETPVDIVGCCFDQNYDCVKSSIRHAEEVPSFGPAVPNIRIVCRWSVCIAWRAASGSIRDVSIALEAEDNDISVAAVSLESGSLVMANCSVSSNVHSGLLILDERATLQARACRFYNSEVAGLSSLPDYGTGQLALDGCWFDGNGISGLEVTRGDVTVTKCIFFRNRFNGLGFGEGTRATVSNCNVFDNRLNGIDVMHSSATIVDCNIERNWCGVRQVMEPDELVTDLSRSNVSENVRAQSVVLEVGKGEDLVAKAEATGVCTFLLTGPHFMNHDRVYRCLTCMTGYVGCCRACRDTCHAGHNVQDWEADELPMSFFCDCAISPTCTFADRIVQDVTGRRIQNWETKQ
jgi:hypothetical protein